MARTQAATARKSTNGTGDSLSHLFADIEKVRDEISKLSDTVVKATGDTANNVGEHGGSVKQDLKAVKDAGIEEATEQLTNIERRAIAAIRKNPVQAVGVAAAAGFLAALLARG